MRIQTTDGYVFEGADTKEIVRKMRDTQWGAPVLKREYMQEVRDRLPASVTPVIVDRGADAFLDSLARNNLIRWVPDGEIIANDYAADDTTFADDPDTDATRAAEAEMDDDEPAYEPDERD